MSTDLIQALVFIGLVVFLVGDLNQSMRKQNLSRVVGIGLLLVAVCLMNLTYTVRHHAPQRIVVQVPAAIS